MEIIPIKTLLNKLVGFESVSPHDAGCQDYMMNYLTSLGFTCQQLNNPPVANFFAAFGHSSPLLIFAGHTDVVPIGDPTKWNSNPFQLYEQDGNYYGRGVADMKGSLACMLNTLARFIKDKPNFKGSVGLLITSGEEGDDFELGTPYVMKKLQEQGIRPDFCIVGEPSSDTQVGDVIKIGRRGSLTGKFVFHGKQGHVAYPHLANNPIHQIAPVLVELTTKQWDQGNSFFPPTSLQITKIQAGGHAGNIIPGDLALQLNFRYSTEQTADRLKQAILDCLEAHQLHHVSIEWQLNGEPFLTSKGRLLETCIDAIDLNTHQKPELSTSGGTSDGRFIAPYGVEVIELGPVNQTIHQVNECVSIADLEMLSQIYYSICEKIL